MTCVFDFLKAVVRGYEQAQPVVCEHVAGCDAREMPEKTDTWREEGE